MLNTKNKFIPKAFVLACLFIFSFSIFSFAFAAPCAGNCRVFGCSFYGEIDHSGDCSYYQNCCIKASELDTSGADPDPIGAGLGAGGVTQDPNAGIGGLKGGTGTPGTSGIPLNAAPTSSTSRSGSTGGLVPCTDNCTLCHLVVGFKNIYDYLLYVVLFPATVLVIVIAGIMYMVSSGNKGMLEKAKSAFTYALAALVLALTAWLIINATLNALGFKNAGSWYNFTCDTTQSKDAGTTGVGGATLPGGSGIRTGSGSAGTGVVSSGNKTLDQLGQYMKENTVYNSNRAGWMNGVFYGDCSSFTQEFWKEAYGVDPGGSTVKQLEGMEKNVDLSTLKAGDLIVTSGGGQNGMHSVIYMGNGMVLENVGKGKDVRYGELRGSTIYGVRRAPG